MFSKSCEYAIKAIVYLATHSAIDSAISIGVVSKAIDSPNAFSAKILQKLAANKIIHSKKGNGGGYYIEKHQLETIYLSNVVDVIDGDSVYTACVLGFSNCSEKKPCPLHVQIKKIRTDLSFVLTNTTINDLIISNENKKTSIR